MHKAEFSSVLIVGLGLIGGSLAKLIRHYYPDMRILGVDSHLDTCMAAVSGGIVDEAGLKMSELRSEPDCVFICVPIQHVVEGVEQVARAFPKVKVISDVASVKASIVVSRETLGDILFVPGHPMAGIEKTGIDYSDLKIIEHATYVVVPQQGDGYGMFCHFLQSLSFKVVEMDAKVHDTIVAAVSHVPYVMSSLTALNAKSRPIEFQDGINKLKSSGFRDTTRVSHSDPVWGHDVCFYNRDAILKQLRDVQGQLNQLIRLVDVKDSKGLLAYFSRLKT